jgi:ATP adenylyltransferase/5',5'''-P-1,P-4-tetraphosphate phosphorylase II
MAKRRTVKINNKRVATVKQRTQQGRLHGRYCVSVKLDKPHKSAVRGVKLAPVEFHGCFIKKTDAVKRATKLSKQKK